MKLNITKKELLNILSEIADLSEFTGANKFKVRAYRNAVNALRYFNGDFEESIKNGELLKVRGIGKGIFQTIKEIFENGYSAELMELKENTPAGIDELLQIRGMGIKKIILLNKSLGIDNLEDLSNAIEAGKLNGIKGFGEKSIEKISSEIERISSTAHLLLLDEAFETAEEIKQTLSKFSKIEKIEVSGELRRLNEVISKIDLVLLLNGDSEKELLRFIEENFGIERKEYSGDNITIKISYSDKKNIFLHIVKSKSDLNKINFLLTGSDKFVSSFTKLPAEVDSENEVFMLNERQYVPPVVRESEASEIISQGKFESDLDFPGMKGLLHFHTIYSDGGNTLEEMIRAGKEKGFEYFAVCDHSKSAFYANGLTEERLIEQKEEIDILRKKLNVPIFHGIESDILKEGALDYSDEILSEFDFIIASVHSNFNLSEDEMTNRIVKAIESPYSRAIGHPTGRLLLRRGGYNLDIKKVLDACAANNTAIEINANPRRLDLDWRNYFYARERGVLFTINADAHATEHIEYTKYGVMIARKGGILKREVINYFTLEEFRKFIGR